jgi:hypothetical protein
MTHINQIIKAGTTVCWIFLLGACSSPPKPTTPALTPGTATALLQVNTKAKNWLEHVKKEDASCNYKIELPDQSNHPSVIDLDHIVACGGRPSPRALDASVSFAYDTDAGHWVIRRFLS